MSLELYYCVYLFNLYNCLIAWFTLVSPMFCKQARVLTETLQVTEAERVVQMGLKLYPKSTPLWRKLLVLHFQTLRSPDDVVICLMRALDSVPEKVMCANYLSLACTPSCAVGLISLSRTQEKLGSAFGNNFRHLGRAL